MKNYKFTSERMADILLLLQHLDSNDIDMASVRINAPVKYHDHIAAIKFYDSISIVELRKIILKLFGIHEMLSTLDSARKFTGVEYFNIVAELEKEAHEPDSSKWIYSGVKRNDLV